MTYIFQGSLGFHSFDKNLIHLYYIQGTILDAGNTTLEQDKCSHLLLVEEANTEAMGAMGGHGRVLSKEGTWSHLCFIEIFLKKG